MCENVSRNVLTKCNRAVTFSSARRCGSVQQNMLCARKQLLVNMKMLCTQGVQAALLLPEKGVSATAFPREMHKTAQGRYNPESLNGSAADGCGEVKVRPCAGGHKL